MADLLTQIKQTELALGDAQVAQSQAQSQWELYRSAHATLMNSGRGTFQQIAASQANVDLAYNNLSIANADVSKYSTRLHSQQTAFNTALGQSNNPAQRQVIGSNLALASADVARNQAFTDVRAAIADNRDPAVINYLKGEATSAEEYYQSLVSGSINDADDYTASVANAIGMADLGDITNEGATNADATAEAGTEDDGQLVTVIGTRNADQRLRIKPFNGGGIDEFLGGSASEASILDPLRSTGGVVFPYTPIITFDQSVNYGQVQPTHANTDYYVYQNTPSVRFTIQGQFSAQTEEEARYMLAAMHFFRASTKMRFGANDEDRGFGPPVLKLSGYGSMMLDNLPIILLNFNMELPNNVNYVEVDNQWVPSLTTLSIQCVVQKTPASHRDDFKWEDFASGALLNDKNGWF